MDESKKVERELVAIQERQVHDDADDNDKDNGHNVAESEDENDGEDDCN